MNKNYAMYIGGIFIWLLSGFKLTYREAIRRYYKESLNFKYLPYKVTVRIVVTIISLIFIIIIGWLLRFRN